MKKPGASISNITPIPGWYQMSLKNTKIFGFITIIKAFDAEWLEVFEENRLNGRKQQASFNDPHRKEISPHRTRLEPCSAFCGWPLKLGWLLGQLKLVTVAGNVEMAAEVSFRSDDDAVKLCS